MIVGLSTCHLLHRDLKPMLVQITFSIKKDGNALPVLAVPTTTPRFPFHTEASLYSAEWSTRPSNFSFATVKLKFIHGHGNDLLD